MATHRERGNANTFPKPPPRGDIDYDPVTAPFLDKSISFFLFFCFVVFGEIVFCLVLRKEKRRKEKRKRKRIE